MGRFDNLLMRFRVMGFRVMGFAKTPVNGPGQSIFGSKLFDEAELNYSQTTTNNDWVQSYDLYGGEYHASKCKSGDC